MKKLAFLTLLAVAVLISGCGSNTIAPTPTSTTNGNWEAQLTGGIPPAAGLSFMVNFYFSTTNGNSSGPVTINDFSLLNTNPCFQTISGLSGTAMLTNNINTNQITGSMSLQIKGQSLSTSSSPASQSVLTLTANPPTYGVLGTSNNGTMTNGAVTGTWSLTNATNAACNVGGTTSSVQPSFIMCQNATTCTVQ